MVWMDKKSLNGLEEFQNYPQIEFSTSRRPEMNHDYSEIEKKRMILEGTRHHCYQQTLNN